MGIFSEAVREGLEEEVTLEQGGERSGCLGEEDPGLENSQHNGLGRRVLEGQRTERRPSGRGGAGGTGRTRLLPA